jgi:hypothetical protein
MSKRKKAAHGGAREGAGRKATLKRPIKVLVTLEGGQARKLAKLCKRTGQNRSAAVRELIDTNIKEESDNAGTQALAVGDPQDLTGGPIAPGLR